MPGEDGAACAKETIYGRKIKIQFDVQERLVRAASTFKFEITPETEPNHIYCTPPRELCARLENFCSRMNLGGLFAEALTNVITNSCALGTFGRWKWIFDVFQHISSMPRRGESMDKTKNTSRVTRCASEKQTTHERKQIEAARVSPPTTRQSFLLSRAEWFARRPGPSIIWMNRFLFRANCFCFNCLLFCLFIILRFVSHLMDCHSRLPVPGDAWNSTRLPHHSVEHVLRTKSDMRGALQLKCSRCNCELKLSARFILSAFCFCTMTMQFRPKRSWNKFRSPEWCKYLRK